MTLHNTFTASVKFLYIIIMVIHVVGSTVELYIIIMVIHVVTQELNCTCIKGNLYKESIHLWMNT